MSKKKAFSGSTMTLKDFHGGSIPSDLPLPSAPGTVVKVPERERQNAGSSWGGPANRGFSAGIRQGFGNNPQRGFEEKVSYLPNSANIGRNFDEDERKPLDGFPRRGGGEEDYQEERRYRAGDRVVPARSEVKSESAGLGIARQQQQHSASSQHDFGLVSNQDRGLNQVLFVNQGLAPLPKQSGSARSGQQFGPAPVPASAPASAAVPNAWGIRREADHFAVNENLSSTLRCAESVASRFAQASAVDKVSSGRWQSRLSFEQQSDRFGQTQHLDSLCDGRKTGVDSGSLGSGVAESDYIGRWTRTQVSTEQNSYDERDRYDVDDFKRNSYVESRKGASVEVGKTDSAKDFLIEPALNSAVDKLTVYAETARASFGESAQARFGSNVDNSGNADAGFNRTDVRADISRSEMAALGNTVPRQLSPVMDYNENKNVSSHLKERVVLGENSVEVSEPYYNTRSALSIGNSRDSLISEGSKSTFYSDYKVSGNVVQSLDNEASRNRFGTEDARLSSPHGGYRPRSSESNLSPAIGSSVHVRSDSSVRPRLNLLPRTKPLEFASETAASEHSENSHSGLMNKSFEHHTASSPVPVEAMNGVGNAIYSAGKALGTSEIEEENRRSGRPKLNLKPRTVPVEQLDANLEKERQSLFGGARPRELVLKERGVDDTVINGLDPVPVDNIDGIAGFYSEDADIIPSFLSFIAMALASAW
ncbi:hypothetical protein SUGI_0646460 [Cryptomeria japonica]|nr:hypothetical protein SUGI_0646460 [Cryptomeria japonica]